MRGPTVSTTRKHCSQGGPLRSGDQLAGLAAATEEERVAAKIALANVPLRAFLDEPVIPYEDDEVTRLIIDDQRPGLRAHFAPDRRRLPQLAARHTTDTDALVEVTAGLTPEMVAAVSKLMRNQDLILAARKRPVVTRFRNTIGCRGTFRCGCSRTIRPTTPRASRHRCSTA